MAKSNEELDKELKNTEEALRRLVTTSKELESTTSSVRSAMETYSQQLNKEIEAQKTAKAELEKATLAQRRLKESLGTYNNSLLGRLLVNRAETEAGNARINLYKKELATAQSALAQQQKMSNSYQRGVDRVDAEIKVREASIAALNRQITAATNDINASAARSDVLTQQRDVLKAEKDASESRLSEIQNSLPGLRNELQAGEELNRASKQRIKRLTSMDGSYASEISAINQELTSIRTKSRTGKKLSDIDQSRVAQLEQMKAEAQTNRAKNKAAVDAEIAARQQNSQYMSGLSQQIGNLETEQQKIIDRAPQLASELENNAEALAAESFNRADLTDKITGMQSELGKNQKSIGLLTNIKNKYLEKLNKSKEAEEQLTNAVKDRAEKVKSAEDAETVRKIQANLTMVADVMKKVGAELTKLVTAIRQVQQSFGITAGQAAKLRFDNLISSVKSYTASIFTLGKVVPVSIKEIEAAQQAFQKEFGGVISTQAATRLASEAKRIGVTTDELAKARRVFMTSSMGNVAAANAAQNKFIAEFQKKGLTSKDAMAAIGQNSELLARNGTRFAVSFARAAADAKKIGVDLSKIDQVGDNIIGDFEGFLEKQAELGAMGFGFDSSRLAEVAETGDTGALMNELRSQLASTGKDITKLRRSEQLALSSAFGISMEELQRLAGPTGGSGEQLTEQQQGNKFLERLVNFGEGNAVALTGIAAILTIIAANTGSLMKVGPVLSNLGTKLLTPITAISGRIATLISKIPGVGNLALKTPGTMLRPFVGGGTAGALAGITGAISGFMTAREEGRSVSSSAGRGYVQGGAAAAGAIAGQALIPIPVVGALIGGFLGNVIGKGLNKMVPELGEGIGIAFKKVLQFFEPVKQAFARIGESFKPLMDAFSKLSNVFNVEGREASKVAEVIGSALAFFLKVGLLPLNLALQTIAGVIKFVIDGFTVLTNIVTALLSLFTFDSAKIKESFGNLGTSILEMVGGVITSTFSMFGTTIVAFFGDIGTSVMSKLSGILSKIPFVGRFFATGDDVISRSGYGERTLITPQGAVALNNQDNVVAYADDFVSNMMGGTQFFQKGALAPTAQPAVTSVDFSQLERKLDQVINAIGSMEVTMDGNKVGKVVVGSEQRASSTGVFRALRV